MKRLIALLIAILTMLLGGIRPAEEETPNPETAPAAVEITAPGTERHEAEPMVVETEPDAELPTEKEKDVPVTESDTSEPDEPCVIDTEPQESRNETPSFQQTVQGTVAEEETAAAAESSVTSEQPDTVPLASIPTAEETAPVLTEKETEKDLETEPAENSNAPVFIDPCQGGSNPFDDETPTEIDEHSSDEFIVDGDSPGEGIHF